MKKLFLLLVVSLFCVNNISAQDFYLNANGVTCMCPDANVGDTGVVNGVTYTKRTKEQITASNASTTCTSGITNMDGLFNGLNTFNGDISTWDVSDVTSMTETFQGATSFNQDLSYWDVSNVMTMYGLFSEATSFNQNLSTWDVSNVVVMNFMFFQASGFNQDLSTWTFNPSVMFDNFITSSGLDRNNYDSLLDSFVTQNLVNKTLNATDLTYCNESARSNLISNNWSIFGDTFLVSSIIAPNDLNIEPNPTTCVASNVNLGAPTVDACSINSITNDAPTEFPIGNTTVTWTLIDGNNNTYTDTQNVNVTLSVDFAEVCYVTSDDNDITKNRIFLRNIDGNNVDAYQVLRETTTGGVYEVIGFIIPPENSFLDTSSNNNAQAYRYKVNTLDVCGSTSDDSPYHKTILLQSSISSNNTINLSWTPYVGTDYTTYNIFRQVNDGDFNLLTSLSSTNLSYNDIDVDLSTNTYEYFVSIDVSSCVGEPFSPLSIKSNHDGTETLSISDYENLKGSVIVYPNPADSQVTINIPNYVQLKSVKIFNKLGQLVHVYNNMNTLNVENLSDGLYFLQIETDRGDFVKKLIKK